MVQYKVQRVKYHVCQLYITVGFKSIAPPLHGSLRCGVVCVWSLVIHSGTNNPASTVPITSGRPHAVPYILIRHHLT